MFFLPVSGQQQLLRWDRAQGSSSRHVIFQADHLSRGVGVAVLAAADVDLVFRGLLVHRVVEVNAVDALKPPVLPEEEGSEEEEDEQCCGEMLPSGPKPLHL